MAIPRGNLFRFFFLSRLARFQLKGLKNRVLGSPMYDREAEDGNRLDKKKG